MIEKETDMSEQPGRHEKTRLISGRTAASLSAALALSSFYQQPSCAQERILEEVIVTAQKRVENVQAIPVTINVMPGEEIEKFRIRNIVDLAGFIPGLEILPVPARATKPMTSLWGCLSTGSMPGVSVSSRLHCSTWNGLK
jgi:hypothetical protein